MKTMKRYFTALLALCLLLTLALPAGAISGTGTAENPYRISTPADLARVHDDLGGSYVLTANLDMSGIDFEPIGNEREGAFTGTIDGQGYSISNFNLNLPDEKYVGLVGFLEGTVKNLTLRNVDACGYRYVGGVVGYAEEGSEVRNCSSGGKVQGKQIVSGANPIAGGVVGYSRGTITSCTNSGSVSSSYSSSSSSSSASGYSSAGGVAGYLNGGAISNCTNSGSVSSSCSSSGSSYAGGVAGVLYNGTITNCANSGSVFSSSASYYSYAGGVVGYQYGDTSTITSCANNGSISAYSSAHYSDYCSHAGGIAGCSSGTITRCSNSGSVSADAGVFYSRAGGIVGNQTDGTISECANSGSLFGLDAGGIAGYQKSGTITNNTNSGSVTNSNNNTSRTPFVGGVVGNQTGGTISKCMNSGSVSASSSRYAGGVVGYRYGGTFTNCYTLAENWKPKDSKYSGTVLRMSQFRSAESFNLDFVNDWYLDAATNSGFPQLRNLPRHMVLNASFALFEVDAGGSERLAATLDGAAQAVTWSSSAVNVAVVSQSGMVTPTGLGVCTVTATNSEGMKANCLVYVYQKAQSLSLDNTEIAIPIQDSKTLTCTQSPAEADEPLIWSSSDETVAAVDEVGTVTGKRIGTARITATAVNGGVSASCLVTVTGNPITVVSLSSSSLSMNVGTEKTLTASVSPAQWEGTLTWSSSNSGVVSVSNGVLTAKAPGTAVVSIASDTGKTASCTVTVYVPVTELRLAQTDLTLERGLTHRLALTVLPENTTSTISWSSSSSGIASVSSDGVVTANGTGTARITAKASNGTEAYCVVRVVEPATPVESVTLDRSELLLTQADKAQVTATVLPANATNKTLTWTSSDESVATVGNTGVVTAVGSGFAVITATAENGISATCAVKVISASGPSVALRGGKASPGEELTLTASVVKNPGMSAYRFTVDYDADVLEPLGAEGDPAFGGTFSTNLDDPERTDWNVLWYNTEDVTENGGLFTLQFRVKDGAELGTETPVTLTYGARDICNIAGDSLALYVQPTTVTVAEPIPGDIYEDGEVTVYDLTLLARYATGLEVFTVRQLRAADVCADGTVDIKDVVLLAQQLVRGAEHHEPLLGATGLRSEQLVGTSGEALSPAVTVGTAKVNDAMEAEIPVSITDNPGIAGFRYRIECAEGVEVLEIVPAEALAENFRTNLGQEGDNGLLVTWYDSEDMTMTGTLFTLRVRLTDASALPAAITIAAADNNMCNASVHDVPAQYLGGGLLRSVLIGDANSDGEVNGKDVTTIRRYLAGGYGVTVDETASDANKDGIVGGKDVTTLRRYLVGGYGVTLD